MDFIVTKVPRFAFEKFPTTDPLLTTQMKSVGEAMAIGKTFRESLQKALRSLETGSHGLESPLGKRPLEPYTEADVERIGRPPRLPLLPPVGGALLAAAQHAGLPVTEEFVARLAASLATAPIEIQE